MCLMQSVVLFCFTVLMKWLKRYSVSNTVLTYALHFLLTFNRILLFIFILCLLSYSNILTID